MNEYCRYCGQRREVCFSNKHGAAMCLSCHFKTQEELSMAYEQRDNTGSLFRNENRQTDNHPTHTGQSLIVCPHCQAKTAYWDSAWVKEAKDGKKYFSLSYKPKDDRPQTVADDTPDGEDVPF